MKERPTKRDSKESQARRRPENRPKDRNGSRESAALRLELQQLLLNVFRDKFTVSGDLSRVRETIQEVKQHLYNRDFALAFGRKEYLEAYAFRWSPSRALAYLSIFNETMRLIRCAPSGSLTPTHRKRSSAISRTDAEPNVSVRVEVDLDEQSNVSEYEDPRKVTKVVCVGGGGGAEIIGLAGLARYFEDSLPRIGSTHYRQNPEEGSTLAGSFSVVVADVADWTRVVDELGIAITTPPDLSMYASETMRAKNRALVQPGNVKIKFEQQDVLDSMTNSLSPCLREADLVTIMFTLNELFSSNIAKTTHLLLELTEQLSKGALLLVVDSPGSYSTIGLVSESDSKSQKKYPMKWLLDHTLLELTIEEDARGKISKWEKLVDEDSRWFRLDDSLQYPVDLEDMRYQMHLFRKL